MGLGSRDRDRTAPTGAGAVTTERLAEPAQREVSWIVPTFNEAPIIADTLRQILQWAASTNRSIEPIVVDDGEDRLEERLVNDRLDGVMYVRGPGRGKGAAVRDGILRSTKDIVVYCDADLPLSFADVEACVAAVESGRATHAVPERSWTFHGPVRTVASVVLWSLQCAIVFRERRFFDTQCGLKVFRRDLATRLASEQISEGGMFDIEYLYRAAQLGEPVFKTRVVQKPEIRPSKIRILRCLVRDPIDLARIRSHVPSSARKGG
jgi:glycosyltransferase involved in cell wall biosynthesis